MAFISRDGLRYLWNDLKNRLNLKLGKTETAADSAKLGGLLPTEFAGNPTFMVSANTTTAPVGARPGDYIANAHTANITIGNLTGRTPGSIVRINTLTPFNVVNVAGNARGPAGEAATITSATANSVSAGSPASVLMGGTAQARTFQFNIPRGVDGSPGGADDSIPTLGIQFRKDSHSLEVYWISGTFKPNDMIFIMRYSTSRPSFVLRNRSSYGMRAQKRGGSKGFRMPFSSTTIPKRWSSNIVSIWRPNFPTNTIPGHRRAMPLSGFDPSNVFANPGSRMKEYIKFMVARHNPNPHPITQAMNPNGHEQYSNIIASPYIYGACVNTLVVRQNRSTGNYSWSVR
jgi:hypothetical protein